MELTINPEDLKPLVDQLMATYGYIPADETVGKTIGMDEFRRKYCGGKAAEWVRTYILDRYPETNWENGGWCVNPHRSEGGRKTIIFEKKAAFWMEAHQETIDWNEKLR